MYQQFWLGYVCALDMYMISFSLSFVIFFFSPARIISNFIDTCLLQCHRCYYCMCNVYLFILFYFFASRRESRQGSQIWSCLWIEYVTTKYIIMLIRARYPNKINRLGIDSRTFRILCCYYYCWCCYYVSVCVLHLFSFPLYQPVRLHLSPIHLSVCRSFSHWLLSIPFLANIKFCNFTLWNRERTSNI